MEIQIGQALQQVQENLQVEKMPEQTNSLESYKSRSKLQDQDKRMMELKYAAPRICDMDHNLQSMWAKSLLLKIHVITGWVIPDTDLLTILIDQFEKKLIENYGMLNVEEIEYAFRSSGTVVKDWGKSMNLALIDEVLIPYLNSRFELSATEERLKAEPPEQKLYNDQELDDQQRADIEAFYQRLLKGQIPYKIPEYFKPMLIKDGLMRPEEYVEHFLSHRLNNGFKNIYTKE